MRHGYNDKGRGVRVKGRGRREMDVERGQGGGGGGVVEDRKVRLFQLFSRKLKINILARP